MYRCSVLGVVACVLAACQAYPNGPPVDILPEICTSMFPTGHNATADNTTAPFTITTNRGCYKDNAVIQVTLGNTTSVTYYEGFFMQARMAGSNVSQGMFSFTEPNDELRLISCDGQTENAISQKMKAHYYMHSFEWNAGTSLTDDIYLVATIVHETPDFWTDVRSSILSYDANCEVDTSGAPAMTAHGLVGSVIILLVTLLG